MEHIFTHILTGLVLFLLAFLFKPKIRPLNSAQISRLDELTPQFLKVDKMMGLSMVLIMWPLLTLFFGGFLWIISQLNNKVPAGALMYFSSFTGENSFDACICVGIGLAIGFSIPIVNFILQNKFAQDFELYLLHATQNSGIDYSLLSKVWVRFFVVFSLFFLIMLDDWYLKVMEDKIEINHFVAFQKEIYGYEKIEKISFSTHKKAPNGDIIPYNRYRILFKDGNDWLIDGWFKGDVTNDSLAKFLSQKTSLKIENQDISDW